ncbi:unnamed protein product [Timema podura]|uniref:Glutamate-rich protein 2 n=1 Tax=Timema podura TaxID=61482 RepID=A0ABN7NWB6_TIMPD|nr:unnamed protein product [Timema podura]
MTLTKDSSAIGQWHVKSKVLGSIPVSRGLNMIRAGYKDSAFDHDVGDSGFGFSLSHCVHFYSLHANAAAVSDLPPLPHSFTMAVSCKLSHAVPVSAKSPSENNGNLPDSSSESAGLKGTSPRGSVEDLSEYTDADESISSAPTEFLAEFLSSLMMKDYETALKYCKLILQYEPHNATAKEFYPLILEKIQLMEEEDQEQEKSSNSEDSSNGNYSSDGEEKKSSSSSDSEATTSYSSLEDEVADDNQATSIHKHHNIDDNGNSDPAMTKSSVGIINGLVSQVPQVVSGNVFQSTSSDSESPTEPVSQQLIAQIRGKVTTNKSV